MKKPLTNNLRRLSVGFLVGTGILLGQSSLAVAFHAVSFDGKFTRWHSDDIHYVVDSRGSVDFSDGCDGIGPCESERTAVRASFRTWANANGVDLNFTEDSPERFTEPDYDHKNTLIWIRDGWEAQSFTPPSNAIAVTITTYKTSNMEIVDCDLHFNNQNFNWAVLNTEEEMNSSVVDLQNIATHEIGHCLGFGHSSESYFEADQSLYLATMFFASGPGEIIRQDLNQDDKYAARNLYPAWSVERPHITSLTPSDLDLEINAAPAVTIYGENFYPYTTASLVMPDGSEDIPARVLSVTDTEMEVAFELYGIPSGEYSLVVANSYDQTDKMAEAFLVTGGFGVLQEGSSDGGGCNVTPDKQLNIAAMSGLFMIFLTLSTMIICRYLAQQDYAPQRISPPVRKR